MRGSSTSRVNGGLSILSINYANDKILFMDHNPNKSKNIKLILSVFEQLLRLKINLQKSGLFVLGKPKTWPFNIPSFWLLAYFGSHYWRLTNVGWKHVNKRLEKRLRSWEVKLI